LPLRHPADVGAGEEAFGAGGNPIEVVAPDASLFLNDVLGHREQQIHARRKVMQHGAAAYLRGIGYGDGRGRAVTRLAQHLRGGVDQLAARFGAAFGVGAVSLSFFLDCFSHGFDSQADSPPL